MMIKTLSFLMLASISFSFSLAGCSVSGSRNVENTAKNTNAAVIPKSSAETVKSTGNENKETANRKTDSSVDKSDCLKALMDGKRLIADQTFVFDNAPFEKSCFVTFASKEEMLNEKDVPRGSTFHIFKDGQSVYDFEDAFNGLTGCWVEGVGFEDLDGDGQTDVIIAGRCLGAKDSYTSNAVYRNSGDGFRTNSGRNEKLNDLTKVSEIKEYVKKNQNKFF